MFLRGDGILDGERHALLTRTFGAADRLHGRGEQFIDPGSTHPHRLVPAPERP
ncbi:hypothetical protein MOPEL_009_00930 [Mobilicoccus pelagius NBRC 104925]|uniref:Uncharacterized protein n=1 Tax=Mobilicoccus pelagius NBRC 104925 TaxID=1089455 RepID=H5UNU4_9MICO|nr:hypothetical protein MOPEL_009_00930 [Mobilicoccus pelagius NBRC 104925]